MGQMRIQFRIYMSILLVCETTRYIITITSYMALRDIDLVLNELYRDCVLRAQLYKQ